MADRQVLPQRRPLRRPPLRRARRGRWSRRPDRRGAVADPDGRTEPARPPSVDRVVDLAGGLVAPGFVDAHVHPIQGGLERIRCDLSELHTREEYLAAVRAYAAAHPELPWILGGGWAMAAFPGGTPTAADLDAVVAGPAGLPAQPRPPRRLGQHAARSSWPASTRARPTRRTAGSSATPTAGPSGTLHEGAMHAVAAAPAAPPPTTEYYAALLAGQAYLHSLGRHRLAGRDRRRLRRHGRPGARPTCRGRRAAT